MRQSGGLDLIDGHAPSAIIAALNAMSVNDGAALAAVVALDMRVDDRRTASNRRFDDGRSLVDALAIWGGDRAFDCALLAHRGDGHALVRLNLPLRERTADCVVLSRCADGQVKELTVFDPEDLGIASYEMALRWADEEPEAQAQVIRDGAEWLLALSRGDIARVEALTDPALVLRDHRLDLAAVLEAEKAMSLLRAVCEERGTTSIDLATEAVGVNASAILVWRSQASATRLDEIDEELALMACPDGRVTLLELFDADQLERAVQRLDALGRAGS